MKQRKNLRQLHQLLVFYLTLQSNEGIADKCVSAIYRWIIENMNKSTLIGDGTILLPAITAVWSLNTFPIVSPRWLIFRLLPPRSLLIFRNNIEAYSKPRSFDDFCNNRSSALGPRTGNFGISWRTKASRNRSNFKYTYILKVAYFCFRSYSYDDALVRDPNDKLVKIRVDVLLKVTNEVNFFKWKYRLSKHISFHPNYPWHRGLREKPRYWWS